ncbi:MAG TPA: PAS domain S-box protein [Enhygromyxa sp.]|nr:PAS domain S-box protein [Enhygromyxa sp.]
MTQRDRILLISDEDRPFALTLVRDDGTPIVPHATDPSSWVAAVREHEWDLVLCPPELLREHAFERGQREVLELIAAGAPLAEQLERIVLLIEAQAPDMTCSILLLDRHRNTLHTGAAPNLPVEFVRAIDGATIGPNAGSCGASAYRNERIIVEDIATHEYWADYRHLALPHGLRACWSTPIVSVNKRVLGTFAMYYKEVRGPKPIEIHWVERATHISSIAIERAKSEKKARLHSLVHDQIADALFYVAVEPNGDYRFVSINPAFSKGIGLAESEVVGRNVRDVLPAESLSKSLPHYDRAVAERRTVMWYQSTRTPVGVRHGRVTLTPVLTPDGRCTHLVGTVHDITELQFAHEQIAAQATLLDQVHDAILVWNVEGAIQYWNKGAEQLYGWTRGEARGQAVARLVHDDQRQFEAAHQQLLGSGAWRGELIQHTRAGDLLITEASWSLLRDEQGAPKLVLAINTDITEKRQLERQLIRGQRLESLGVLASGIAHDFNNILTAISGNAGLARTASDRRDAGEFLTQIEQASERGADLVRQLFTFSRQRDAPRELVDLTQIATESARLLRASLPVEIRTQFAPDVPRIHADATQMHQVMINLITNAAHAMAQSEGWIDVLVDRVTLEPCLAPCDRRPGSYARLRVIDRGTGMSEATLQRIFDPFFTTKPPGQGTGLGLAVVHGIVDSHAGAIVVHSTPGAGTEVEVCLPAAEPT